MATLLIIDDSAVHRAQISRALEQSRVFEEVLVAEDGVRGLKYLLNQNVDVVLCDLEMPGLDGEKLLRVKDASPPSRAVPFVFLTGSQDLDRRVRLLEDGAADLVLKPFHPGELVARLRLHLKLKKLQDELRVKNETLARLSTTDGLTGLRTRRYANEVLAIEFLRARRYQTPLSVLMADLDHFKLVNDSYGHAAGDAVLRAVSGVLLSRLRATDVAGRWGGEEFLVILSQSSEDGAMQLAEHWRSEIEEAAIEAGVDEPISARLSIGVASYRSDMKTPDDLVAAADAALYRAKEGGRNRVEGSLEDEAPAE